MSEERAIEILDDYLWYGGEYSIETLADAWEIIRKKLFE